MTIRAKFKLLCAVAVSGFAAFAMTCRRRPCPRRNAVRNIRPPRPPARSTARSGTNSVKPNVRRTLLPLRPAAPAPAPAAPKAAEAKPAPTAAPEPVGNAVFPSAINPKYASESAGKGRMHTCVDQYNANKAGNGNGGLKWIMKGGGYYSECNKKLKGA